MSKNKNKPPYSPPARPPVPAVVAPIAPRGPTPQQVSRLDDAEVGVELLTEDLGPPTPQPDTAPVGPTVEAALLRAEGIIASARSHFEKAREREAAAKAAEEELGRQKRDQAQAFEQRKKAADADHVAKLKELEKAEQALAKRIEDCAGREAATGARDAEIQAKAAEVLATAAKLTERELNAEQGFVTERTRVLEPLTQEVDRLRSERERLDNELRDARSNVEAEVRAARDDRARQWAEEDKQRGDEHAGVRRAFDEEMAATRKTELAKLRDGIQRERQVAEAAWSAELAAGRSALAREAGEVRAALATREGELDTREDGLNAKASELRVGQRTLRVEQEILAEDRAAQEVKVARLVDERSEDLRHQLTVLERQLEDARTQRDAYFTDLESRRELDRRFGSRKPEEILSELTRIQRERDDFCSQLQERPDAGAANRLAELERERSSWLEHRAVLQGDLARANGELATRRLAAIELETLRKEKEALEIHKQLLDGAVDELRSRVDELTRQDDRRNPMTALTSLDESEEYQTEARTTSPMGKALPSLRDFAADLRHRIATGVDGRTLYYSDRDVRSFLGGLAMTRLMLLQGISGTGKTSLPLAFASAVGAGIEVVEVQAGWRDRQDLVGYYNAFHRHYYATNFLQALYKAGTPAFQDRLFLMVLDEVNLSRPEQFFADFLSALEQPMDSRRLTLVNDQNPNPPRLMPTGLHLPIPPNVWFVGTANHDESTAEFADKTYDRAHVMEMPRKTQAAHFDIESKRDRNAISYTGLESAFTDAAANQAKAIEHATEWLRKAPFAQTLGQRFRVGWGNRLENQLARYLPVVVEAGGTVGEAMDHLLVTKVFRKLKDRHDVRATALEELQGQLLGVWDKLDPSSLPERCDALIQSEIAAKQGEDLV